MDEEKVPERVVFFCKKRYLVGVFCILFIIGILFFLTKDRSEKSSHPKDVRIAESLYHLEIADTYENRAKGLGGRDGLCEDCGMLFVFDTDGQYAFWMKDMRFPIDIIWLRNDEVVFLAQNVLPESLDILKPPVIANKVLEVNAGKGKNIHVGEKVRFE